MRTLTFVFVVLLLLSYLKALAKPITVMVIDTGIAKHEMLDKYVDRDGTDDYEDIRGHGTHVAGILLYGNRINKEGIQDRVCEEVKLISCRYYYPGVEEYDNGAYILNCVKHAVALKVDYINMSGGGKSIIQGEFEAYQEFIKQGGIVVAAAGNNDEDLLTHKFYPASYGLGKGRLNNFYVVMNARNHVREDNSNYHPMAKEENGHEIYSTLPGDKMGILSGSSMAAPQFLHKLLKERCLKRGPARSNGLKR